MSMVKGLLGEVISDGSLVAPKDIINEGSLSSLITFTRASTKSRYNAANDLQVMSSGQAVFDYFNGEAALSMHTSEVNQAFQANISIFNSSLASITTGQTSPDPDDATARLLDEGTANNYHAMWTNSVTRTNGETFTDSIFVKAGTCDKVQMLWLSAVSSTAYANFDLTGDGEVTASSDFDAKIVKWGNDGWYRISVTLQGNGSATNLLLAMLETGNEGRLPTYTGTNRTVYVYGAQIENNYHASPYIPTTNADVTREADSAVISGADFTSLYNAAQGTFLIDWVDDVGEKLENCLLLSVTDGSTDNRIELYTKDDRLVRVSTGGISRVSANVSGVVGEGNFIDIVTYRDNNFGYFVNGMLKTYDINCIMPTAVDRVGIGCSTTGNFPLNGYIRKAQYYDRKLSDKDAARLSAKYVDFFTEGDSYVAGANGIGINASLEALGHVIATGAQGGDTLSGIQEDFEGGNSASDAIAYPRNVSSWLAGFKKTILCDGSVNGNSGVIATEIAKYQAIFDICEGNIIIVSPMLYSGLYNTTDGQFTLDLTAELITTFGSAIVVDSTAIARTESGASFTDATDASDAGYNDAAYDALFQADNVHMGQTLSDAVAAEILTKV